MLIARETEPSCVMAHDQRALAASEQHASYYYYLYGLNIRSELRLPTALQLSSPPTAVDAEIIIGQAPDFTIPAAANSIYAQFRDGAALYVAPGIARYLIQDGVRIVVQPQIGSSAGSVHPYLLGAACGLLLHQRGDVVLHAGGVATAHGAALFMGNSGVGKSTLVAALRRNGHRVLSDDVCVIKFDALGQPMVYPGPAQLKLWRDAAATLGVAVAPLLRADLLRDKYLVPLDISGVSPVLLRAVYIPTLTPGQDMLIEPLSYRWRVQELLQHTYNNHQLRTMGLLGECFTRITTLAKTTEVKRLHRPQDLAQLTQLVRLVEADIARTH